MNLSNCASEAEAVVQQIESGISSADHLHNSHCLLARAYSAYAVILSRQPESSRRENDQALQVYVEKAASHLKQTTRVSMGLPPQRQMSAPQGTAKQINPTIKTPRQIKRVRAAYSGAF